MRLTRYLTAVPFPTAARDCNLRCRLGGRFGIAANIRMSERAVRWTTQDGRVPTQAIRILTLALHDYDRQHAPHSGQPLSASEHPLPTANLPQ